MSRRCGSSFLGCFFTVRISTNFDIIGYKWTRDIVIVALPDTRFIFRKASLTLAHIMRIRNAKITEKKYKWVIWCIFYLKHTNSRRIRSFIFHYLSNPCRVGRYSLLTPIPRCHFPTWQVAYPSAKRCELIVGYFSADSPPTLSGQNTPGYIPVDTGYFPVSSAALIYVD